jgi:hypothetical protein
VLQPAWLQAYNHRQTTPIKLMAEKPSKIAIVALVLSVITASFSTYQWWDNQRNMRIAAAIEVSKKYESSNTRPLADAVFALVKGKQLTRDQASEIFRNMLEMEYLAFLANRNKIDVDYLSYPIKCSIYASHMLLEKFRTQRDVVVTFPESAVFSSRVSDLCDHEYQSMLSTFGAQSN